MRKIASKAAEKGKKLPIVVLPQFSLIIVVLDIERKEARSIACAAVDRASRSHEQSKLGL